MRRADSLLISDLVDENETLKRNVVSLYANLKTTREVLSLSLQHVYDLTKRSKDQNDQIRRLMGVHDDALRNCRVDPWYPTPEQRAAARVKEMVQADEIRWTLE